MKDVRIHVALVSLLAAIAITAAMLAPGGPSAPFIIALSATWAVVTTLGVTLATRKHRQAR